MEKTLSNFTLDYDRLPKDVKVFLDCIDIVESSEATNKQEILDYIDKDSESLIGYYQRFTQKEEIPTKIVDSILDNHNRLEEAKKFLKTYFNGK